MPGDEQDTQTSGFRITVLDAEAPGSGPRVAVAGELDLLTSPRLQETLTSVIDERPPGRVLADLTEVTFFDSSALNVLLQVQRHAEQHEVVLVVRPSKQVQRVIDLTGVAGHLVMAEDAAG
jgi:anti-sigma B factor antagonist